jgi:hypothetical protein
MQVNPKQGNEHEQWDEGIQDLDIHNSVEVKKEHDQAGVIHLGGLVQAGLVSPSVIASAPFSTSQAATSVWPKNEANMSGVILLTSCVSIWLGFFAKKSWTAFRSPFRMAGRHPVQEREK